MYNNFMPSYTGIPYMPQQSAPTFPSATKQEIIKVNGKNGAEALQLAPNSSVFVADETKADRIWLCMTDGAGFKTVRAIHATFEDVEEKTAIATIEERLKKLEEKVYDQLNTRSAEHESISGANTTSPESL